MSFNKVSMQADVQAPATGDSKTIRGPQNKYFIVSRSSGTGVNAVVGIEVEKETDVWVRLLTITCANLDVRGEGVLLPSPFDNFRSVLDSIDASTGVDVDCCL